MKEWPVGSNIVVKSSLVVSGDKTFMDVGYKYRYQSVVWFIAMDRDGSTEPSVPC